MASQANGSILVVGGGIAGIQSALDLANSGFFVYLVERDSVVGGKMAQLDKTFPTNDCSMCIISPKLVEVGRHLNIELLTLSEVTGISGDPGNFTVTVKQSPRYVDSDKCIACGVCAEKCPAKTSDEFNQGLAKRKAAYLPYPQAVPAIYALDPNRCIYFKKGKCKACEKFCPSEAIKFDDQERIHELNVGAVILSPGFKPFDPKQYETYNYLNLPNVITSLEFERILSASGPYGGHMARPSDGADPKKIAWLQCVGSRDINQSDYSYCSSVCCMYATKQTIIAKEHSDTALETSIFFMDMRCFGKDFDKYYERAKHQHGVRYIRSRVHSIDPAEGDRLHIRYATEAGKIEDEIYDMVVLSVGLAPGDGNAVLGENLGIALNTDGYAITSDLKPVQTTKPGIFACGAFQEPKDIPYSVMEASAAAASASAGLREGRWNDARKETLPEEKDVSGQDPRIGVFVCNCGINIGGVANIPEVCEYARDLPNVVYVEENLFTCSQDSQEQMKNLIDEYGFNRVVVASCSPRTHEPLFQSTIREAGLNKYLFEMANIRDQNTWVHMNEPDKATQKAKDLVRMAVAKANHVEPLHQVAVKVNQAALIIGGGVAGMEAALGVAEQGCETYLIEKSGELGGNANILRATAQTERIQPYLKKLKKQIQEHPQIKIHMESAVTATTGTVGNFTSTITNGNKQAAIEHGATIIATGGQESRPTEYSYGEHPGIITHLEMDVALRNEDPRLTDAKKVAFIQCVGSRNDERPYCSKICCTHSIKSAIALKNKNPDMRVYIIYRDIRAYGYREKLYREARQSGVIFIRYSLEDKPQVGAEGDTISLTVTDHVLGQPITINPDVIVLSAAVIPNDNKPLYELFKVPVNDEGFLVEAHAKLRPVDFASDGIFLAGLAHYPKPIEESIAQAKASAARAMTVLSKDAIMVGGIVAAVTDNKCAGCLTCVRTCPYNAPYIGSQGVAIIEPASCHGCGACVSECPGKAITLQHFTDDQIAAKIDALFAERVN